MLSRILSKSSSYSYSSIHSFINKTLISSSSSLSPQSCTSYYKHHLHQNPSCTFTRYFSTNNNNGNGNVKWPFSSPEPKTYEDETIDSIFAQETTNHNNNRNNEHLVDETSWFKDNENNENDIFKFIDNEGKIATGGGGFKGWEFGEGPGSEMAVGSGNKEEDEQKKKQEEEEKNRLLDVEAKELFEVLQGPNHAFGDLIAASGITDEMLDSLMALKDLGDVPGLPPLSTIEDMRYEKNTRKSTRADIERQKQEEIANARVRQVDSQGRAYGTGKRKCSIARVWVEPGEGKFVINDKQFDVYFPMLDQRAALLRPLSETKTLGLLDINCTVKGGGMSGQVGAIRLGMSRALQNWAPDQFRPPLKEAGFLTRDSRIVERKKPGKPKARKSFQWVKR